MIRLFFTDCDPAIAAQNLCDADLCNPDARMLHVLCGHTCDSEVTTWVRESMDNWIWVRDHIVAQHAERLFRDLFIPADKDAYQFAFNRASLRGWIHGRKPTAHIPNWGLTPFPRSIPEKYQWPLDDVEAWRLYYFNERKSDASWTRRTPPQWFVTF